MQKLITLKNGLRVHFVPLASTQTTTVLVLNKVGSRYEKETVQGVSHFIEHLMFKGTKKRPSSVQISRLLDAIGAEFNAYTGKDVTGYYVKADSLHQKLAIELLYDMLSHSLFRPNEMKRERKVILEEIHMYHDNPLMHVDELLEEILFEGNTLGQEIAGTVRTVQTLTHRNLVAFWEQYYIPSRMVIVVAGAIDPSIHSFLDQTFGTLKPSKKVPEVFSPFTPQMKSKPRINLQYKETKQVQFALGFYGPSMKDEDLIAAKLLAILLGGTMSSRLFLSVREKKGLAYMIHSGYEAYEDIGYFWIQAGLDQTRLPLALRTIFAELKSLKTHGILASELAFVKEHLQGKLALQLEDSADQAQWFGRQELFLQKTLSVKEWLAICQKVKKKDIESMAHVLFKKEHACMAAIGPFKEPEAFETFLPKVWF